MQIQQVLYTSVEFRGMTWSLFFHSICPIQLWWPAPEAETPLTLIVHIDFFFPLTNDFTGLTNECSSACRKQECLTQSRCSPWPSVHLAVTLYNCSVGRSDCSRCHTADPKYGCVWCGGALSGCLYRDSCADEVQQTCPAPVIHLVSPGMLPLRQECGCGGSKSFKIIVLSAANSSHFQIPKSNWS